MIPYTLKNNTMKRLGIALFAATMVLCACEKIYTTDELGAIVEWSSSGWSIVQNDLSETVTLVTTYRPMASRSKDTITSILTPGDTVQLHMGAFVPGVSIDECITATIKLRNETDIVCTRGADDPCSKHFFQNFQQRSTFEVVELHGKNVRHDMVIRTYHIDQTLVDLWKEGLKNE